MVGSKPAGAGLLDDVEEGEGEGMEEEKELGEANEDPKPGEAPLSLFSSPLCGILVDGEEEGGQYFEVDRKRKELLLSTFDTAARDAGGASTDDEGFGLEDEKENVEGLEEDAGEENENEVEEEEEEVGVLSRGLKENCAFGNEEETLLEGGEVKGEEKELLEG